MTTQISNDTVLIFFDMLRQTSFMISDDIVAKIYDTLKADLEAEIDRRKLSTIYNIYDKFNEFDENSESIDFATMSDNEVIYLYLVANEIEDFSCLGENVRPYVDFLWNETKDEIKNRKLDVPYLTLEELKL